MNKENFNELSEKSQKDELEKEIDEYNEYIIDLSHNPKNRGKPPEEEISVSQSYTGPCGDTIQFFLTINGKLIERANFITEGCGACIATEARQLF